MMSRAKELWINELVALEALYALLALKVYVKASATHVQ